MLFILKHDLGLRGTKSPVSVFDEKLQANQDRVHFKHLYLFLTTKNSLFTSDIHYL